MRRTDSWAREATGRGRGMEHVRVACDRCHDQLRQTLFFEPPHDSGYRLGDRTASSALRRAANVYNSTSTTARPLR